MFLAPSMHYSCGLFHPEAQCVVEQMLSVVKEEIVALKQALLASRRDANMTWI
eukprot:m.273050 g.273050  ORF g.273050 m.273050 type:complete len:53 (+) comp17683_c0_seq2:1-159(+)